MFQFDCPKADRKTMLKFAFQMEIKNHFRSPKMLRLFGFIALTLVVNFAFSQKSSREFYSISQRDSVILYIDSAQSLASRSPLKAAEIVNKAIEWSIRNNEPINESKAYFVLGNIQQNMAQHELALAQFRKSMQALSRAEKVKGKFAESKKLNYKANSNDNSELWFNNYLRSAQSYSYLKNAKKADEFIKLCLSNRFIGLPTKQINEANRTEAQILAQKGQSNQAIQNLNLLIEGEKRDKNKFGEIEAMLLLGQIYKQIGNYSKAKETLNLAKNLADQNRLSNLAQKANEQLAGLYQREGNLDDEINARYNSLNLNNQISNSNSVRRDKFDLPKGISLEKKADFAKEESNSNQTEKDVQLINSTRAGFFEEIKEEVITPKQEEVILQENAKNLKRLAEVYTQKNDVNKAIDYYKQYAKLQDSIIAAKTNELANIIALSTNIGKNQQRIEMMEQERQLNEKSIEILQQDRDLKQSQLNNRNIIIITLSFAFIALLFGALIFFRNLRAKRKADKLLTLQSLGGQMNPHFIFNALNSVNEYIAVNDERAANRYLTDFSKLMRKVLDDSRHAFIPISEELNMLKLYLQLEHARFKDKFDYELQVDENLYDSDFLIPPMLIQPFIENAVWHGLRYLDSKGKLSISVETQAQTIVIAIVDNGIGIEKSKEIKTRNQKKQESMGMKNIETRVKLMNELYHSNISLVVKPSFLEAENPGTTVIITIAPPSAI